MALEKQVFRSTVADLIDFEPEENPPWRKNDDQYPSTRKMVEEIVEMRQKWDSTKDTISTSKSDAIKRQLLAKFFYHCNVEEEHGLRSVDEIQKFLGRSEENLSKGTIPYLNSGVCKLPIQSSNDISLDEESSIPHVIFGGTKKIEKTGTSSQMIIEGNGTSPKMVQLPRRRIKIHGQSAYRWAKLAASSPLSFGVQELAMKENRRM